VITPGRGIRLDNLGQVLVTETGECRVFTTGMDVPSDDVARPVPQGDGGAPMNLRGRFRLYVRNGASDGVFPPNPPIFVGGAGMTKDDGYPLLPQESVALNVTERVQVYVLVGGGGEQSANARTMEVA